MSIGRMVNSIKFKNCNALSKAGKCTRLTVFNCQGEKCPFKRTPQEDLDSTQYVYQRISNLDSSTQEHIARKYYGGSMPWRKG